jgi:DNA-directed RNA polymerase specialized sigma24 family protein
LNGVAEKVQRSTSTIEHFSITQVNTRKKTSRDAFCHDPDVFATIILPVATIVASKMLRYFPGEELDELAQVALLDIWKKRRGFRTTRGATVEAWAAIVATRRLHDLARRRGANDRLMKRLARELIARGEMPEAEASE